MFIVQGVLKRFASLEFRLLGRGNLDPLAGARVAPFEGPAMGHTEGSETHQANFNAALECIGNGTEHTVDGVGAVGFRETGAGGNGGDEVVLVHGHPPKRPAMRLKDVVEVSRRREAASLDRAIRARQCAKWQKTAPSRPTWAYFLVDIAWGVTPISFREQSNS